MKNRKGLFGRRRRVALRRTDRRTTGRNCEPGGARRYTVEPPGGPQLLRLPYRARRQYVVNLEGTAEFETADGSKVQMEPGDVLVAET